MSKSSRETRHADDVFPSASQVYTPPAPAPKPRPPAPPGSHYETLRVCFDATEGELRRAYHDLMMLHHPDRGGTEQAAKSIIEAHSVLSNPEMRSRYDSGLKEHHPERYKISYPALPGVFQWTDDLRLVRMARNRGLPIEDNRPGEPGGEFDRSIVCRWKITIPPNRAFTGKSFKDIMGEQWVNGVLYTDNPDAIAQYRRLDYTVEDRGHFDNLPDSEFNTVSVHRSGGVGKDGLIYPVILRPSGGGLAE